MGLDFSAFARVAGAAGAGWGRGQVLAEEQSYKRKREEEERQREIRHTALREELLQLELTEKRRLAAVAPDREHLQQQEIQADIDQKQARAMAALPDLQAPDQLPGEARTVTGEELKPWYQKAGFATADEYWAKQQKSQDLRRSGQAKGRGTSATKPSTWQKEIEAIAEASKGDQAAMHREINNNPSLFALRTKGEIRDYHIQAAASKARKGAMGTSKGSGIDAVDRYGTPVNGPLAKVVAAETATVSPQEESVDESRPIKFPSESPEQWVARMIRNGVPRDSALAYARQQGMR